MNQRLFVRAMMIMMILCGVGLDTAGAGFLPGETQSARDLAQASRAAEAALKAADLWTGKIVLTNREKVADRATMPPTQYVLLSYYRYEGDLGILVTVRLDPVKVTQIERHPHWPTSLTAEEMAEAERLARARPEVQKALKKHAGVGKVEVDVVAARIIDPAVPGFQHRVARLFFRDGQRNYLQFVPMVDVDLTTGEVRFDLIRSFHEKQ